MDTMIDVLTGNVALPPYTAARVHRMPLTAEEVLREGSLAMQVIEHLRVATTGGLLVKEISDLFGVPLASTTNSLVHALEHGFLRTEKVEIDGVERSRYCLTQKGAQ